MGRRGPPRKPQETLQRRGSWLAKQREDDGVLEAPKETPRPPYYLANREKYLWREVVGELERLGVVARIDRASLTRYCQMAIRYRDLSEVIRRQGETYLQRRVVRPHEKLLADEEHDEVEIRVMVRPETKLLDQLASQLLRLEVQFGMTPAARSSIHVPKQKKNQGKTDAKLRVLTRAQEGA